MDIVIATNNADKLVEYKEILHPLGFNCLSLKELNIDINPEETGTTFAENSLIKATTIAKYTDKIVIADDSGIVIDAMPNELGVYSKRFMENSSYQKKMEAIIKRIENDKKTARYVCVITLVNYDVKPLQFEGICEGSISNVIKGTHGFGYDPFFIPVGSNKTIGEIDETEKHKFSHRGLAAIKLSNYLKESVVK